VSFLGYRVSSSLSLGEGGSPVEDNRWRKRNGGFSVPPPPEGEPPVVEGFVDAPGRRRPMVRIVQKRGRVERRHENRLEGRQKRRQRKEQDSGQALRPVEREPLLHPREETGARVRKTLGDVRRHGRGEPRGLGMASPAVEHENDDGERGRVGENPRRSEMVQEPSFPGHVHQGSGHRRRRHEVRRVEIRPSLDSSVDDCSARECKERSGRKRGRRGRGRGRFFRRSG